MAKFHFTVDTREMARSIDGVSNRVEETTEAVGEMRAAIVAAEEEAARKISQKLNYGFYFQIRSQISQNIAMHKARAEAKLLELRQYAFSLAAMKEVMERDYMSITARYEKIFRVLASRLREQIFALDKKTIKLANQDMTRLFNRISQFSGTPIIAQNEYVIASQKIVAGRTRQNSLQNIAIMKQFIADSEDLKTKISSILGSRSLHIQAEHMMPVLLSETTSATGSQWVISVPEVQGDIKSRIVSSMNNRLAGLSWEPMDTYDASRIKQDYAAMVQQAMLPDRHKKLMMKFIQTANWLKPGK